MNKTNINYYSRAKKDGKFSLYPLFTDEQKEHQLRLKKINDEKNKIKKNKVAVDTKLPIISKPQLPKEAIQNFRRKDINKYGIKDTENSDDDIVGSGIKLLKIEKSPVKFKKYRADALIDGEVYKNVDFGDSRYQQFKDSTPLQLYSHLDHNDTKRLRLYYIRNQKNNGPSGILSKKYLW